VDLNLGEWLGLLTAGAALAALGFRVYQHLQGRPVRRVSVHPSRSLDRPMYPPYGPDIIVIFTNVQGPPVMLREVGFESEDGTRLPKINSHPDDARLPVEVLPGHSVPYYFRFVDLHRYVQHRLRERKPIPARAYCRDATNQYYKTSLGPEIRSALGREIRWVCS